MRQPNDSCVLVLGSKPDAVLPDLWPRAIYTANGAAARALGYLERAPVPVTCVAARGAVALPRDQAAIIAARPDRVIIRRENREVEPILRQHLPEARIVQLSEEEQWLLQRRIVGWRLLIAELQYARPLKQKIRRLRAHFAQGGSSLGASTGLFAALLAADEHPKAEIVMAGIGVEPGGHFYGNQGKAHGDRSRVDAWLLPRLPTSLRTRLTSTDQALSSLIS